jgi:AraC family transcriptional regulator of adaptative response / DNA-3-methyladenine glycosylase II
LPLHAFLAQRALPGVEVASPDGFRRAIRLGPTDSSGAANTADTATGHGIVDLRFGPSGIELSVTLNSASEFEETLRRVEVWLDLRADAVTIDAHLATDPNLATLIAQLPGLRVPGTMDPFETAVRAIIGQQVSVAGARTVAGRVALKVGVPLLIPDPEITHLFPGPAQILHAPEELFAMPDARRQTIRRLAEAVLSGAVNLEPSPTNPVNAITAALLSIKGIGPWTASYIAMRALGDRDVFLPTDLGVIRTLERQNGIVDPERWRPYRSYALHHLWLA